MRPRNWPLTEAGISASGAISCCATRAAPGQKSAAYGPTHTIRGRNAERAITPTIRHQGVNGMNRRDFLKNSITVIAGLSVPLSALQLISPKKLLAGKDGASKVRWAFLVDTQACMGCGFCVKACKTENEIPYDANITRTWVERYIIT